MGIITKEVEIKPSGKNIQYYRDLGYDAKYHKPLVVKVKDLPNGSGAFVDILCDYCNKNIIRTMYKDYNRRIKIYGNCACSECKPIKVRENNLIKYGVESTSSLPEVRERVVKTNIDKYGYPCSLQNDNVRQKAIDTCRKNYGVDYSIQCKEIWNKTKESLKNHYGYDNAGQIPEIKEKIAQSFYKNNTQKSSKQQRYINFLYGGELNSPVSHFNIDICFPDEKLAVEYDGGFHDGMVKTGRLTQEEHNQKEIIRNNIIKRECYKTMRIVSRKDFVPSDTILLQMLSDARNYFAITNHSWCSYDIDKSLLFNAENKNGTHYDFGTLRKIKDEDLTNQNKNQTTKKGA